MALAVQTNYLTAVARGFERVRAQDPQTLAALGATATADGYYMLPVLNAAFAIDLEAGSIVPATEEYELLPARKVGLAWQILALHYMSAPAQSSALAPWISFADLADGRGYEQVYRGRVIRCLCATAGRDRTTFVAACQRLGAQRVVWGDEGFRFQVFPCLPIVIAWYDGDGEFPPNASFLYPDNILSLLPVEDVVVLSEGVVSRLQGKDW